jgi:hypothetical protein
MATRKGDGAPHRGRALSRFAFILAVAAIAAVVVGIVGSSGHSAPDAHTKGVHKAAGRAPAAGKTTFSAKLRVAAGTPRAKGVPKHAAGMFTATLEGSTLVWTLKFSGLSGKVTAAQILQTTAGKPGIVVVALCGGGACKSPATGSSLLGSAVVKEIQSGGTSVNLQTKRNPNGELGGQIKPAR